MDDEKIMMASKLKNNTIKKTQQEDLPNGWIKVHLENIATIILGQSPPSSTYNKEENGFPFFQGKADFGQLHPTVRTWCTAPKKISEKNDILISVRAPVGSTNISTNTCCIGRGLSAIRPLEIADMMYVFYHLRYLENHISQKGTGTTFKAITGKQLRSIELSLSPLPEQQRIVAKIESIFAQIDAMQKKLEAMASQVKSAPNSLDTLKNSVLNQTFDNKSTKYKLVKLKDYLEDFEKRNPENEPNLSFKYVEIGGIGSNKKIINFKNLFGHNAPSRARNVIRVNDVIYGTTRPYYRNVVLVPSEFDNEVCSTGFCVLRSKHLVLLPAYLFYYMLSNTANEQILKFMRGGNYPAVSNTNVINIDIPLPHLPEQHRIVAKIESIFGRIDAIEEQVESSLIKLEQLKKIILKKAFEGKLVHQDPNDEPASVLLEKIKQEKSQIHKK